VTHTEVLLLDLGNVVIELDPKRTFDAWARSTGVPVAEFAPHFGIDDAYRRHEIGAIDFAEYIAHLETRLGIRMPLADWRQGWNALFVAPFAAVVDRLPAFAERYRLCCFTNTNATHQADWETRFPTALVHFERIYSSPVIGRRKPDVTSFAWLAEDLGVAPSAIHFLDDHLENVEGARAAGLRATHTPKLNDVLATLDELVIP